MASYNKNPAALNEPDGIVAVWNLHLLERPEFVFHSQVRQMSARLFVPPPSTIPFAELTVTRLICSVRRPLRHLLAFPSQSCIWRNLLRADSVMGYTIETSPRAEDTTFRGWTYTSCLCHANGRHAERTQLDY